MTLINRKVFIIILFGLLVLFPLYLLMKSPTEFSWNNQQEGKILTVNQMTEDLDFLVKVLNEVHPQTVYGWTEDQQNLINEVYDQISNPMEDWQFYFMANRIIHALNDSHSSFFLDVQDVDILDFPISWLEDGLYIIEDTHAFLKGDKVVSIGGRSTEQILNELAQIIPAENHYWVKALGAKALQTRPLLSYLELPRKNMVSIEIERGGALKKIELSLDDIRRTASPPSLYKSGETFVSYKLEPEHSLGIFILDQCIFDDEYIRTLNRFFLEVSKNNIDHIVVDLRNNSGGNSLVIDEFLKYIDVGRYKTHDVEIRFSSYSKEIYGHSVDDEYISYPSAFKANNQLKVQNLIFKGSIYMLTSSRTYSSANMFAVTFKDNQLGLIVGEPTGNAPSSYGDILPFQLPNSGYQFTVSYKKFIRPNPENDPEDALYPDIPVYTTIKDIKNGSDPQMDRVRELIKETDIFRGQ